MLQSDRYELQTITKSTIVCLKKLTLPGACGWQTANVQVVRDFETDLITLYIAVVRLWIYEVNCEALITHEC